jgi:hypothetical protein
VASGVECSTGTQIKLVTKLEMLNCYCYAPAGSTETGLHRRGKSLERRAVWLHYVHLHVTDRHTSMVFALFFGKQCDYSVKRSFKFWIFNCHKVIGMSLPRAAREFIH